MEIVDYAKEILFSQSIDGKLLKAPKEILFNKAPEGCLDVTPGRNNRIQFSDKQIKFPGKGLLKEEENKAIAFHFFANHELEAIEMMACALLVYPHHTEELKKFKLGLVHTIADEQKHFSMYLNRIRDFGSDFGDFPLNDFFWKQMCKLKTPSEFLSVVSLTFEAANLDFADYYSRLFASIGDKKSSEIMKIVYKEELAHVRLGSHYLNLWRNDKTLWQYYLDNLPWPITPSRSRGTKFNKESRRMAGIDDDFIENLLNFDDKFLITKRKL